MVDLTGLITAAKFQLQVTLSVDAVGRHLGIELKGPPGHRQAGVRSRRVRPFKPPLADVTPWADNIGKNLDLQHHRPPRVPQKPVDSASPGFKLP